MSDSPVTLDAIDQALSALKQLYPQAEPWKVHYEHSPESLRDLFAMAALGASHMQVGRVAMQLSHVDGCHKDDAPDLEALAARELKGLATTAYRIADAMLAARGEGGGK